MPGVGGSGRCPGPAGHCLAWASWAGAPTLGKSEFHIIFLPSGESWGPPPCTAPQGQTLPWHQGGFSRGRMGLKPLHRGFISDRNPETAPCCCLLEIQQHFPSPPLLPKALLCAAIYWCTGIKLAAATSGALCTCKIQNTYSNKPITCSGIFVHNFLIPAPVEGQTG